MAQTIQLRAEIDDYTNRVLGVVKEKFGLKDKSAALNKFAEMYGDELVEKEVKEEFIARVLSTIEEHHKKYPNRRMTLKELDELTGI
ncbi:MAG: DUF2683 family protein [Nanoarchaeota archaeon]|nr:DUF2683 family protein [Nanoarchaeota archaeon]MBU1946267.1 DUF2683 family protein [Nanoarchaeota archaeon]